MTLAFSTHINGQPTHFVEKIWAGLNPDETFPIKTLSDYAYTYRFKKGDWPQWYIDRNCPYPPKLHTIRADTKNRWKPGNKIHPVINNRTKDRFQFGPTLVCKSVQEIEFYWWTPESPELYPNRCDDKKNGRYCDVYVDNLVLMNHEVLKLAHNDGFDSVESFFQWFNEDFKGKIIHWTDLKY